MSTPPISQKCDFNVSYCKLGCQTLLDLLGGFGENVDGVIKNDDVERVHKTRVASRKLRAALPLFRFCFPTKEFKVWQKEIKKVTELLGEARDLDVQIVFIEDYIKKIGSADKKYVDLLLEDHKCRRVDVQSSVADGLNKLKESKVLEELAHFCQQTIADKATDAFDTNQVLEKGHWHIWFRLDEFLANEKYVYYPNENKKHHQMRIAAKKLRYTMEFFAPLYKEKLQEQIETIKKYQDILGEKHDCEVWIEYIPKFVEKIKEKKTKKLSVSKFEQALLRFQAYIKEQRQQHYAQFVSLWEKKQKKRFF